MYKTILSHAIKHVSWNNMQTISKVCFSCVCYTLPQELQGRWKAAPGCQKDVQKHWNGWKSSENDFKIVWNVMKKMIMLTQLHIQVAKFPRSFIYIYIHIYIAICPGSLQRCFSIHRHSISSRFVQKSSSSFKELPQLPRNRWQDQKNAPDAAAAIKTMTHRCWC